MGSLNALVVSVFMILQLTVSTLGTPSYREYRILTGYPYSNSNSYVQYPDRTYYTNPYTNYQYSNYKTTPSYQSNPYDGQVYITDKYGQTSFAGTGGGSSLQTSASNYYPYYSSRVSRARGANNFYGTSGCNTGLCGQTYGQTYRQTYGQSSLPLTHVTTCSTATCGNNAHCTTVGGRPVCSCLRGYIGDPLYNCNRAECLDNSECRSHLACRNDRCVDPCQGVCGANANCEVRNHVPICACPAGYTGDPFSNCRQFNPEELCHPSPCGANTQCEVVNNVPTCKCLPGYHGSAISGCRHECENDAECGSQMACIEFRCQNPCSQCGINAECDFVQNHVPVCKCPRGYLGNALTSCQPECTQHSDCPPGKPACFYNSCKNPCDGVCGIAANCELRSGITPVCSCPRDMTGDPFTMCRPFTKEDLCEPNPCGANAKCQPGYDRTNKERPVCTCHPGYIGDPITGCIRGECVDDVECPDHQACFEYKCQNPCRGQCGANAMCNPRRHIAVCTCHNGFNGDALTQCHRVETSVVGPSSSCLVC